MNWKIFLGGVLFVVLVTLVAWRRAKVHQATFKMDNTPQPLQTHLCNILDKGEKVPLSEKRAKLTLLK